MSATATRAADSSTTDSPYVGLKSYGVEDADVFFGRETETEIIVGNLCASRLTVLYADSGAGKSSVLRAGVTATLLEAAERDRDISDSAMRIPVMFASWRDDPLQDLRAAIAAAAAPFLAKGEGGAADDKDGPAGHTAASLADMLAALTTELDGQLLVVLDQFEEYLLYRSIGQDRDVLADELARCINRRELQVNFLISIREDAYAALGDLFRGRLTNVYANTLHLEHLGRDAAREAIERPLERYNEEHPSEPAIAIEKTLVDTVLEEVRTGQVLLENAAQGLVAGARAPAGQDESIETPYMQLVMTRLWEIERGRGSRLLRRETLQVLGGSQTIVRTHLTRALGELEPRELATATEVFLHLVTPSGTKIAQSIADLSSWTGEPPELIEALVAKLAASAQRIVRPLPPAAGSDSPRVEIFHDVLAKAIVDWCQRQTERRLRHERNAARRRTALVSVLAFVAIVLAALAYVLREHQIHETHLALSRALASQSGAQLGRDASLASLLAVAGDSIGETNESHAAVFDALQLPLRSVLSIGGPVAGVAYADGGRIVATADRDGSLELWNSATGARVSRERLSGMPQAFAASGNGQLLATGDENGHVEVWDVSRPMKPTKFSEIAQQQWGCATKCAIRSVAFSPRGGQIAFGDEGGEVILWKLAGQSHSGRLLKTEGAISSVAFDPAGDLLAAGVESPGGGSGELRLWSIGRRTAIRPAPADEAAVTSVAVSNGGMIAAAQESEVLVWKPGQSEPVKLGGLDNSLVREVVFSPDPHGAFVASANESGQVNIYSTKSLERIEPALYDGGEARSLAFDPGGDALASGTVTGRVLIWRLHSPARSGPALADSGQTVNSVSFSPNGSAIVTSDYKGVVKRWNAQTRTLERPVWHVPSGGEAVGGAIDPSGRFLVAGARAGEIAIWPLAGGAPITRKISGEVTSVAVSRDGVIAAGTKTGVVDRWRIATGARVRETLKAGSGVTSVAFSYDSDKLAAGTEAGKVEVWNAAANNDRLMSFENPSPVTSVAFNPVPRSETLAIADRNEEVLIWSLQSRQRVGVPVTDRNPINTLAYSPDGRVLAVGDQEGSVLLASAQSGVMLGSISGDAQSVEGLAFNPTGKLLAAAGGSGEVSVYSPEYGSGKLARLSAEVCARVHTNLTPAEWAQYVPGESYRRLCPGSH